MRVEYKFGEKKTFHQEKPQLGPEPGLSRHKPLVVAQA
jgi:hypothetical protein